MTTHDERDVVARFWRGLEELEEPQAVESERVPEGSLIVEMPVGRRRFLQLLGSTVAIPSLAACTRQPEEKIVPYVKPPEQLVPGKPLFYATATLREGIATGVLVETHMGRPTKVEGNAEHPASLGGTDAIQQAEILELYDPDRSQTVLQAGAISSWSAFVGALQLAIAEQKAKRGGGLRILTGAVSSPTFLAAMDQLLKAMPDAKWHVHEPAASTSAHEGTRALFGDPLDARYQLNEADVVLSLDADLFGTAEGNPRYMREFADRRRKGIESSQMNRVYAVETSPGLLGAVAEHRVAVRASEVEHVARAIAAKVLGDEAIKAQSGVDEAWIHAAANDLKEAGEHALVVPGKYQPAIVHRLAHAMNMALGAVGKTVDFIEPVLARSNEAASLSELAEALEAGKVDLLVVMGVNPVYSAPGDLDFATRFTKAKLRVHLGRHVDETGALCHWHIPEAHPFEAWGDAKSYDGTMGFIQPLIEPLYGSKSPIELLAALGERPDRTSFEMVREYWMGIHTRGEFDHMWRRSLHDGVLAGSRGRAKQELKTVDTPWPPATPLEQGLELVFRPHALLHDGRYANNGWLQELPEPLTKLTWDNAVWVAPELAKELDLENEDVVDLAIGNAKVRAPVWVMPGAPKSSVTVHLGYGRVRGGKVLVDTGFDAYRLRTSAQPWHLKGLTITKTGDTRDLASAQMHHSMEGRDIVRSASVKEYFEDASVLLRHAHGPKERLSMYPRWKYPGYAWGMAIDLASCLGCSACVVACQAENNIPVVGKSQVLVGREMHWLRVDRYYEGAPEAPRTHFQPIPCMQCETAPCEAVCPVAATAHHDEGLNDMVYNRCVGTRYCQNNCPYKVRRFNFHRYSTKPIGPLDPSAPSMRLLFNPDVTVRSVGVMEKCTYCVQRISQARIASKREDRRIADGEVMTACQAACPARAITFGDINDKDSDVAKRKSEVRNYALLAELNTEPRTTYLAKIDNPNSALRAPSKEPH